MFPPEKSESPARPSPAFRSSGGMLISCDCNLGLRCHGGLLNHQTALWSNSFEDPKLSIWGRKLTISMAAMLVIASGWTFTVHNFGKIRHASGKISNYPCYVRTYSFLPFPTWKILLLCLISACWRRSFSFSGRKTYWTSDGGQKSLKSRVKFDDVPKISKFESFRDDPSSEELKLKLLWARNPSLVALPWPKKELLPRRLATDMKFQIHRTANHWSHLKCPRIVAPIMTSTCVKAWIEVFRNASGFATNIH